jgi:hypothetical protein
MTMSFPTFSTFRVDCASVAGAMAALALLGGCASKPPTTIAYIRAGQFVLRPESVAIADRSIGSITAKISAGTQDREIMVMAPECKDGVGNIVVPSEVTAIDTSEILAFARSDQPADKLFSAVCNIGLAKMNQKKPGD